MLDGALKFGAALLRGACQFIVAALAVSVATTIAGLTLLVMAFLLVI